MWLDDGMQTVDEHIRAAILRSMEAAGRGDPDISHEIYADDGVPRTLKEVPM